MKDLIVLVADHNMEAALRQILKRNQSLSIRPIDPQIFPHPRHDPGVLNEADNFLATMQEDYSHALVVFDRIGCGQEEKSSSELKAIVQTKLDSSGWQERSGVVVIDPELENWIWTNSPHVSRALGIKHREFLELLKQNSKATTFKPDHPKELLEDVLRRSGIPRSSSLYAQLAKTVSLRRCIDPSFNDLKRNLRDWFGTKQASLK